MTERSIEYLTLDEILPADQNPKSHDEAGLAASVERFGYVEPITIDERTGNLVAGHGRLAELQARRDRGDPPPDGVLVDESGAWRAPVVRGWASADDAEAKAYLVASNRLTERGGWHAQGLADMLAELAAGPGLEGVGYDADDLATMLADLVVPDFAPTSADEQPRLDQREPIVCPHCGEKFVPGAR